MLSDKSRRRLPPYVSYRTFRNFVDGLQQRVPARIDRSYWGDMLSGSTGTQLMAALRYLDLIDANGRPTTRLKPLASAKGDQRTAILRDIVNEAFSFVLDGSFDPQSATYAQLEELFYDKFQLTSDLGRKCIKFFIELSNDAGIPLSPFITKRLRSAHTGTGNKTAARRPSTRTNRNWLVPQQAGEVPEVLPLDRMLITKFPTFDPTWPDEVKLKWFAAFDELLRRATGRVEKQVKAIS
jgi:hypothetical protein